MSDPVLLLENIRRNPDSPAPGRIESLNLILHPGEVVFPQPGPAQDGRRHKEHRLAHHSEILGWDLGVVL